MMINDPAFEVGQALLCLTDTPRDSQSDIGGAFIDAALVRHRGA
jgi:hypothetical protein